MFYYSRTTFLSQGAKMRREDEAEEAEEEVILEPKDKLEEQGEGSDTSSVSDILVLYLK